MDTVYYHSVSVMMHKDVQMMVIFNFSDGEKSDFYVIYLQKIFSMEAKRGHV